ncbi:MAG: M15 family metallopeptidase [Myxococcaceae bacterium]
MTCNLSSDTGYVSGQPFTITLVDADGKLVELATANAYAVMQAAAANDGINLAVVSGFRTMAEQQYLYACYVNCNCNNCNLAAQPGYSNHQSGHALDLNTSSGGVYNWLANNAGNFGFKRTVPSEEWHWEWWGGGPGGGPCGNTPDNCTLQEAQGCGGYGCGCADHQCSGGACPGSGCSAQHAQDCGNFGCNCADGTCAGGFCPGTGCSAKETNDCGAFGCGCVDHLCSGGACPNSGCTAKETTDCGNYGCGCADHQCSGGFCPGSGCTLRETLDCAAADAGCVGAKCVANPEPDAGAPPVVVVEPPDAGGAPGMGRAGPDENRPLVDHPAGQRGGEEARAGARRLLGLPRPLGAGVGDGRRRPETSPPLTMDSTVRGVVNARRRQR